jgi:hypothetical protein
MREEEFSTVYNEVDLFVKPLLIKPDNALVKLRKTLSEHPFGTVKRAMDKGYCLLKGIDKVRSEYSLAFLAFNLKRAISMYLALSKNFVNI